MEFRPHAQAEPSQEEFSRYGNEAAVRYIEIDQSGLSTFISQVFLWMFAALLVTAATSFAVLSNESLFYSVAKAFWPLVIIELIAVFSLSAMVQRMNPVLAAGLFFGYSVLNGVTLTPLLARYSPESVIMTFAITGFSFGAMAAWGLTTKKDLTNWGSLLFMGLVAMIILGLFNMFFLSPGLHTAISAFGIFLFIGLIAYDTQMLKGMYAQAQVSGTLQGLAILGALSLYLDFINLFINLLRFFGSRDD